MESIQTISPFAPASTSAVTSAPAPVAATPDAPSEPPIIAVSGLNVIYNQGKQNEVRALEGIDVEILPREFVIIFGPSGCGKSTLLYAIAGLQRPTTGHVVVKGEDIAAYDKRRMAWFHRRIMGMVFQAFYLIGSLDILDNVCLPKAFDGVPLMQRRQRARELLERFGIVNQADKFPSQLSGGQKQRVSIARALVNDPEIILADEPVGNLDSKSAQVVMSILKELNENDKKTVILVTHDPSHLTLGDRVIHMKDGKVVKVERTRKKALAESFVFKDGAVHEQMERDEYVPLELRHLMRSFKGLTASQIGYLLVPFKAQQVFSHLFFSIDTDQVEHALHKIEDYLRTPDLDQFVKGLDLPLTEGGAGWNKKMADRFAADVKTFIDRAHAISFLDKPSSAADLVGYFETKLDLHINDRQRAALASIILDRLDNRIGGLEVRKLLDLPTAKNGGGLNAATAKKISRELELLLLLRYSA